MLGIRRFRLSFNPLFATEGIWPYRYPIGVQSTALRVCMAIFFLVVACQTSPAQTGEWTWMGGSSTLPVQEDGRAGVYGTQGVASPQNVPGSRYESMSWTDNSGKLWMFGGLGSYFGGERGNLNDLWEFNPSTNEWTWWAGTNTQCTSCQLYGMYGTHGVASTENLPGARTSGATWTDANGHLWLFGGQGYGGDSQVSAPDFLNDLWEFDPATKTWAWMNGSSLYYCPAPYPCSAIGTYGTKGVASPANTPGGRVEAMTWVDKSGILWLYGGQGLDANANGGVLDDLWKFDPSTDEWTWMGGDSTVGVVNDPVVYGTPGVPAAGNTPGARYGSSTWTDTDGNLWLFGGQGLISQTGTNVLFGDFLNDLWEYNQSAGEWEDWFATTCTDPSCAPEPGVYGTQGVPDAANVPGAREYAMHWTDANGKFWLYGGQGVDSEGNQGYAFKGILNDLWEYDPDTHEWAWMDGDDVLPCPDTEDGNECVVSGTYGTLGIPGSTNEPGSRNSGVSWADSDGNLWFLSGQTYGANGGWVFPDDVWRYQPAGNTLPEAATPVFSPVAGTYATAQSVTLTDSTAGAAVYYTTDGTTPTGGSTAYSGPINAATTETVQAIAIAPGYAQSEVASATYTITASAASFTVTGSPVTVTPGATSGNASTITVTPAGGFTGQVLLTAAITMNPSGAQSLPTLSFGTTSPVSLSNSSAATAVLTIKTKAASTAAIRGQGSRAFPWSATGEAALACVLLFGIPLRRRKWRSILGILVLAAALTGGVLACGGGGGNSGGGGGTSIPETTPGSYTVTVTGTSGNTTATGTVMLTVQ